MSGDRIMETSLTSQQGPRKIFSRRRPIESEKTFHCECGKSYLSKESLYTHRKMKHPAEFARYCFDKQLKQQQQQLQKQQSQNQQHHSSSPSACAGGGQNEISLEDNGMQWIGCTGEMLEADQSVRKVLVSSDTFTMLTKSAFLNFFKEMKILADTETEIMGLFHSEKRGYTKLDATFFAAGCQAHLVYFIRAYRVSNYIPDPREQFLQQSVVNRSVAWIGGEAGSGMQASHVKATMMTESHANMARGHFHSNVNGGQYYQEQYTPVQQQQQSAMTMLPYYEGQTSQAACSFDRSCSSFASTKASQSGSHYGEEVSEIHGRGDEVRPYLQRNVNGVSDSYIQNVAVSMGRQCVDRSVMPLDDIPEYYRDFFTIAKEIVKPMEEKFAMEICYLFNRLIEVSSVQQNLKIEQYQSFNQKALMELINKNQVIFEKFMGLTTANRNSIIEKLLFNLAHLFSTAEAVPDD